LAEVLHLRGECRRLQELSRTDPLTGLYNWRHLITELDKEMERTRRTGLPTGLIMLDLDHFKGINDTFGHQFGDAVLRRVCRLVRNTIRRLDIPCRYGGEEFAIILPGTSLSRALRLAERLRLAIAQAVLKLEGRVLTVTASFGVDVYAASERLSAAAFLKRADELLLEAKAKGRNTLRHRDCQGAPVSTAVTPAEREQIFPRMKKTYAPEEVPHAAAAQAVSE
jgi:diguanylate cyclase (GGDEF)-like protein